MRKRLIILTVSLSIVTGALSAYAVSMLTQRQSPQTGATSSYADPSVQRATDAHFTTNPTPQGVLPDFTTAAESGVKAVVNVERRETVRAQQYGYQGQQGQGLRGFDPFELFFGPQPQQQQPQRQQPQSGSGEKRTVGGGSGVIISEDGYIISNNHVVENAEELVITLHDGSSHKAKIIGTDPTTDIALLKIEATGLTTMPFGNSDDLRLGEWVLAIGNPYGLSSTVTAGIVSAKGRNLGVLDNQLGIESFIQTDAAVNPGNSGGALITIDGNLVGINTVIKSPTGSYAGYSFAVPSTIVRKVVTDLREHGIVQRAMLGISFSAITDEWIERFGKDNGITKRGGVFIGEVTPEGAAEAAGIKKGDVLTHIGAQPMNSAAEVQEAIARLRPNDKINVTIKRGDAVKQIEVTLRNRAGKTDIMSKEDVDLTALLGAKFREITDKQKKDLRINGGIQVIELSADGLLAQSRVQRGFIITAINERPISSVSDLVRITDAVQSIDGVYPDGRIVSYQAMKTK